MPTRVYLKGNTIVVDNGVAESIKYMPSMWSRFDVKSSIVYISDTNKPYTTSFPVSDLRDELNNTFATESDAIDYLTEIISFKNGGSESATSGPINRLINFVADDYTDLTTVVGITAVDGDIAYVIGSQGTKWLPGSIGGSYFPSGFYVYGSGAWNIDENIESVAEQLSINANTIAAKLDSVVAGFNISVDNTDPNNPIIATGPKNASLFFTFPISGVIDNNITVLGTFDIETTGENGNYTPDFPVSNQHLSILVNSITTGGDIIITGTSISEINGTPVPSDTETLTLDTSTGQYYQTNKKWLEITDINVSGGTITGIDYDVLIVGYHDSGNGDFKITGYRADMYSQSGTNSSDITVNFTKIQDDGSQKMSLVTLENIGIDSGGGGDQLIDNLRTGGSDRSYNPVVSNIWLNNTIFTLKQNDFDTFFSSGENIFDSSTKDEGLIVALSGAPGGGITGVDFINLRIDIEFI